MEIAFGSHTLLLDNLFMFLAIVPAVVLISIYVNGKKYLKALHIVAMAAGTAIMFVLAAFIGLGIWWAFAVSFVACAGTSAAKEWYDVFVKHLDPKFDWWDVVIGVVGWLAVSVPWVVLSR